ncbi:MAG: hypothetical protein ACI9LS_000562 [Flavobacteriales bacterium]|jgi:uncharacterized protein (TIGR01777 family)
MNVIITGGSGLIGSALSKALVHKGHEVVILTRNAAKKSSKKGITYAEWNPSKLQIDQSAVDACDAIINLAGANVAQRWTNSAKKEILNSRILSTRTVVEALEKTVSKTLINASAIGIYPFGSDTSDEGTAPGDGFLQEVVKAWEEEGQKAKNSRLAFVRIGIVLSKDGGALEKLIPLFKLGLGSAVGSGKQWQSWIHIDDLVSLFIHILENPEIQGVFNGVSPNPVTNHYFSKKLAQSMNKPFWAPKVPRFILKLVLGEMSQIILNSQKVVSKEHAKINFDLKHSHINDAFNELF